MSAGVWGEALERPACGATSGSGAGTHYREKAGSGSWASCQPCRATRGRSRRGLKGRKTSFPTEVGGVILAKPGRGGGSQLSGNLLWVGLLSPQRLDPLPHLNNKRPWLWDGRADAACKFSAQGRVSCPPDGGLTHLPWAPWHWEKWHLITEDSGLLDLPWSSLSGTPALLHPRSGGREVHSLSRWPVNCFRISQSNISFCVRQSSPEK